MGKTVAANLRFGASLNGGKYERGSSPRFTNGKDKSELAAARVSVPGSFDFGVTPFTDSKGFREVR